MQYTLETSKTPLNKEEFTQLRKLADRYVKEQTNSKDFAKILSGSAKLEIFARDYTFDNKYEQKVLLAVLLNAVGAIITVLQREEKS